jgi:hypothetical protein
VKSCEMCLLAPPCLSTIHLYACNNLRTVTKILIKFNTGEVY